jgi:hypothetical protein
LGAYAEKQMRVSGFNRYALCSYVAAAMLAGCGGSQPPIGAPGAMTQTSAIATHADRGKSWMLPEAKSEDLLYVSDSRAVSVYVFSYPGRKTVGTLNGLVGRPDEVCSDEAGNVFVTEYQTAIQEYAHGGTTPIATLEAPGEPEECSVDPTTGNLAVGIYTYETYKSTGVAIYSDAQGSPTLYTDSKLAEMIACSYDDDGNLFVAGRSNEGEFALAELPAGSFAFVDITLKEKIDGSVRDIQWTGSNLAIGDYINGKQYLIYRVAISGTTAKIVGDTQPNLEERQYFSGDTAFFIRDNRVAINVEALGRGLKSRVLLWPYPRGAMHLKRTPRFGSLYSDGVTISAAPLPRARLCLCSSRRGASMSAPATTVRPSKLLRVSARRFIHQGYFDWH